MDLLKTLTHLLYMYVPIQDQGNFKRILICLRFYEREKPKDDSCVSII